MLIIYVLIGVVLLIAIYAIRVSNVNSEDIKRGIIQKLMRQASRWAIAGEQDKSPIISVLHANYGAGYLWAIKDIATNDEVFNATGINMNEFENKVLKIQDATTRNVVKSCPEFKGDLDNYLQKIASSF